jgi:hypothetical protein
MYAVILHPHDRSGAALWRIAGRPLVARQIQWLRAIRCDAVAVAIDPGPAGADVARWLTEEDAIGALVSLVRAGPLPLSPREVARRAGFPDDAPLLVIPADVIAGGPLGACIEQAARGPAILRLKPPRALGGRLEGADLAVDAGGTSVPITLGPEEGWAVRVRSCADAMEIGAAVIDGRLCSRPDDPAWGIQVHAPEIAPGIWVGRGAVIAEDAALVAPVLVGAEAVVCSGARVGPRVCLGERAVVEAGTSIRDAVVSPGTIVGEGLDLFDAVVEPRGLVDPATGALRAIEDPLVLAARDRHRKGGLLTRALSLALLVALLPLCLVWLLWGYAGMSRGLSAARAQARSPSAPRGDTASPG